MGAVATGAGAAFGALGKVEATGVGSAVEADAAVEGPPETVVAELDIPSFFADFAPFPLLLLSSSL